MSDIEKIRQEIERRIENYWSDGDVDSVVVSGELEELIDFIDSLPDEKPSEDLEDAAEKYSDKYCSDWAYRLEYEDAFIAGAKWQANRLLKGSPLPEDTILFQKGVEEGRRLEKDEHRLAWEDIRRIVKIADNLLDDPKARVAFNNHNEEYYYKKVLDEYNKLRSTEEE